MLITKDTPLNIIETAVDGDTIFIDKAVSLDSNFVEIILQKFPKSNISIITSYDHLNYSTDVLYTHDELEKLAETVNIARQKYDKDISFDEEFSIEQAIDASRKLNEWEKFINEAKIDGKPLSPLEKYMVAYSLVSKRYYNLEDEGQTASLSRNIISVLNNDYICCAGFANTLSNLCSRIGIPCVCRTSAVWKLRPEEKTSKWGNHANCIVRLEDDKYGVHGFFNSDPTWDAIKQEYALQINDIDFNFNFTHFLIPHNEYVEKFPNIVLDRMTTKDDEYIEKKPSLESPILGIDSLFPEFPKTAHINETVFNPESHEVDFALIKHQTTKRLLDIVEKLPERKIIEPAVFNDFEATFDSIIAYFIQESIERKPEDKGEFIYYLMNYFGTLCDYFSKEQIMQILSKKIADYPLDELQRNYESHRVSQFGKLSQYDRYKFEYLKQRGKTKPLSKNTLMDLFETVFPFMFNFESQTEKEKFCEQILYRFSPVALLENQKTPN